MERVWVWMAFFYGNSNLFARRCQTIFKKYTYTGWYCEHIQYVCLELLTLIIYDIQDLVCDVWGLFEVKVIFFFTTVIVGLTFAFFFSLFIYGTLYFIQYNNVTETTNVCC